MNHSACILLIHVQRLLEHWKKANQKPNRGSLHFIGKIKTKIYSVRTMQKICSVNELRATFMFRPSFIPAPTHLLIGGRNHIHTALINSALCSGRPTPTHHLCYPLVLPQHQKCDSNRLLILNRATRPGVKTGTLNWKSNLEI